MLSAAAHGTRSPSLADGPLLTRYHQRKNSDVFPKEKTLTAWSASILVMKKGKLLFLLLRELCRHVDIWKLEEL